MSISEICDIIIIAGTVALALTHILNFLKKPHTFFKKKKEEEEEEKIKEVNEQIENFMNEKMPDLFLEHDLETRNKYLADRQQYLCEIKAEVLKETKEVLDNLLQISLEQSKNIEILTQTSKDVLRQRIMDIYHRYKCDKAMPIHAREALDELYKDYKAEHGNSYIDKYYNRMKSWDTYDDEIGLN